MSRVRRPLLGLALALVATFLVEAADASASSGENEPIVVHVEQGGFRWSDAAVGGLAGVGISLVVCGCVALVRLRGAGNTPRTKGEHS